MTAISDARESSGSVQTYAGVAGILLLISFAAGGFGEAYVPSQLIVSGNPAATAHNITASDGLFRLGFIAYLIEAVCDVALALIFYVLLKPVSNGLALLAAFFGMISTTLFAVAEMFFFCASIFLGDAAYLKSFSPDQLNTLALLFVKMYGIGATIFMVFYGIGWILRGYLIVRSGYLPKIIGLLLIVGGLAFAVRSVAFVLAPAYPSSNLLLALFPGGLLLALWLIVRGVNLRQWEAKVSGAK